MRIKNIYARLKEKQLDGLLLSSRANISYLTGFSSRDAYLLVSPKGNVYFTDSRYIEEAKNNLAKLARLKQIDGTAFNLIAKVCSDLSLKTLGFEEKYLFFCDYNKLKAALKQKIRLIPTQNTVEEFRQVKDKEELLKIEKAASIAINAMRFIENQISPGRREIEIAADLEKFIRYNGARSSAFNTIVASGPNSSFPHHQTSERRIKNQEAVLVDLGVDYLGYKSDLTRVFFLGRINALAGRIYDIVRKAQEKAMQAVKPGVNICAIDLAARQYISKAGFGKFFGHALGHGVGLEVHEAPRISQKETNTLKAGMVFTVEPAIYLPNKFGIRIEDMVLVTPRGGKIISGALNK